MFPAARGVFFDVYGTLLVLTDADRAWADWSVAFYETLRRHGLVQDPEIFRIALERTGLSPHEVIHVGDSGEDVAGATAAGCQAVQVLRAGSAPPGQTSSTRVISRLTELFALL